MRRGDRHYREIGIITYLEGNLHGMVCGNIVQREVGAAELGMLVIHVPGIHQIKGIGIWVSIRGCGERCTTAIIHRDGCRADQPSLPFAGDAETLYVAGVKVTMTAWLAVYWRVSGCCGHC